MVQLGLLRVKADSAQPATPRGPAADQQPQVADGTADSSAAEAAMQLSTGDPAPQQPAAAQAAATPVADGSTSPPTAGQEPGLANGDPGGDPGADAVHAASAPSAVDIATAGPAALGSAAPEADAEDVDVDMDIDPMAGAHALSARLAHADWPFRALLVVQKLNTCSISPC